MKWYEGRIVLNQWENSSPRCRRVEWVGRRRRGCEMVAELRLLDCGDGTFGPALPENRVAALVVVPACVVDRT